MLTTVTLLASGLLAGLAFSDLRERRLSNRLVALYALLCPLALLASDASRAQWWQHGVVMAAGFGLLLGLYALRGLGGGDVKLGAAVLGWSGVQALAPALMTVAVSGLLLALLGLAADAAADRARPGSWQASMLRVLSARRGVPYGVALALGGLAALGPLLYSK